MSLSAGAGRSILSAILSNFKLIVVETREFDLWMQRQRETIYLMVKQYLLTSTYFYSSIFTWILDVCAFSDAK